MNQEFLHKPSIFPPIAGMLGFGLLDYFLSMYTYGSPNRSREDCWAGDESIYVGAEDSTRFTVNVTEHFHTFFIWEWVSISTTVLLFFTQIAAVAGSGEWLYKTCTKVHVANGIFQMCMLILATIYRFSNAGKACSGDFYDDVLAEAGKPEAED